MPYNIGQLVFLYVQNNNEELRVMNESQLHRYFPPVLFILVTCNEKMKKFNCNRKLNIQKTQ